MNRLLYLTVLMLAACDQIKLADPDENIIRKCESSVTSRLQAPSTYKRISASAEPHKDFPRSEMEKHAKAIDAEPELKTVLEHAPPTKAPFFTVRVEYDAQNAFGVPIRDTSTCWMGTPSGRAYAAENHVLTPIADTDFLKLLAGMRQDAELRARLSQ